jgi:serine/threonine protein kinase/cytochrome c-type biogenesis protein CcmH/NrfG
MPRVYQQGDEPVRGYRLVKYLGKGSFGDVWQAAGPGGTEVAFKIIKLEDKPGFSDLRSIEHLKKIKHPNLCPVIALWTGGGDNAASSGILKKRDSGSGIGELARTSHTLGDFSLDDSIDVRPKAETLFIAMGLGEKSLLERFKECREKGDAGIPTVELIGYIEDASRAIDHLNLVKHDLGKGTVAIPHGDIKPQNLLLVGGAVQVCDAGLAHILSEKRNASHPGVSVAFTAPEMLDSGSPSPFSDQYSLAITYHFLRTGALPFSMNEANVVLTEALEGRLDLSRLSTPEQQVIRRAVSRRPDARFANCQDFARELRRAIERSGTVQQEGLVIEPNREIVPGHKLVSLIGRGAYGEVWQAQAPGRLPIALKIIKDLDRASGRGKQEFRALEIIQNISHNSMMELRAYWLLDRHGQPIPDELRGHAGAPVPATLVIATRLADKNLSQVLEKYREEGKPGIPVKELLGYMNQVGAALDYLNQPRHKLGQRLVSIQHRDVKPDNIMIANDTVKLTDFGLAKVMETENVMAEIKQDSVGFTFHYAAPEVLRGKVTKWSDQYSLAITYFQLRTGTLPYGAECSAYDQMMRQLEGQLDLNMLLKAERQVVARATSVIPEERFDSCHAFLQALSKAVPATGELIRQDDDDDDDAKDRLEGFELPPIPKRVTPKPVVQAVAKKDMPSDLVPVGPPVAVAAKGKREPNTMPVALRPGEVYPAPVQTPLDATPEKDTTRELPLPQVEAEKAAETKPLKQYLIPLAMVFVVGIGMALLLNQLWKKPEEVVATTPVPVVVPTETQSNVFIGPQNQEYRPLATTPVPDNYTANKPNDIIPAVDQRPTVPPVVKVPDLLSQSVMPEPTKPIPVPIIVLGKNVADPAFPGFLQTSLDRLIASTQQPVAFSRTYRELEQVPTNAITTKLLAFRAECLIEGESKNLQQAVNFLNQASVMSDSNAYTQYVQARYYQEIRDPWRAVNALEESLKRDISLAGFRRERALGIFEEAAQRVTYASDPATLNSSLVSPIPTWLSVAERFQGKPQPGSTLALMLALKNPPPKDPTQLQSVIATVTQEDWLKKPQGVVLATSLKLKQAEATAIVKQPVQALNIYADIWNTIKQQREAFDATSPLVLNQKVIAPGRYQASLVKPNPVRNAQLASFLAGYGELLFNAPYESWSLPANQPALRVSADAFAEAAKLYPGSGRIKAEYLTGQGQSLNRLGSLAPQDISAISTNAMAAIMADPNYAGGWNIMGLAKYYKLAQETSEADLRRTLTESIDAYDKAIRIAEQSNPRDKILAQYRSNRSLAKSMLGDFTPVENEQRRLVYQDAISDAQRATELDANYESAWGALGQARERLADAINGPAARPIFAEAVTAYRKQLEARPSLAQGYAYLGRCLVRWSLDDNNDLQKLEQGRDELNKAIKLDSNLAEAQFWLGRYYLAKNDVARANESFLQAIRHPDLGKNFLNQSIALLYSQPNALLPLVNQVIPASLNQCKPEHVSALIVRSTLARKPVNTSMPWLEAKPLLDRCVNDAQTALKLCTPGQLKQRADATEAIATSKLLLFAIAPEDQGKAQYRNETIAEIRNVLKLQQQTPGTWELAWYLARFLDADAVDANEETARKYRQEALQAMDVALAQAPAAQKEQLRRFRNDVQSRVK